MNLLRALATVSSLTMVSRVLGFARDFVIARAFAAGVPYLVNVITDVNATYPRTSFGI